MSELMTVQQLRDAARALPRYTHLLMRGAPGQLVSAYQEAVFEPKDIDACAERFCPAGVLALAATDDRPVEPIPHVVDLRELLDSLVLRGHGAKEVRFQDLDGGWSALQDHPVWLGKILR